MPLNRFLTFIKPYLNALAGALAAFLIAKANVLGLPGLGEHGDELTTAIAAALAWTVTQGAAQLGDRSWLKGHHLELAGDAQVQAAAFVAAAPAQTSAAGIDPELEALVELGEDLPDDDEEFAAPPDHEVPSTPDHDLTGRVDEPDAP